MFSKKVLTFCNIFFAILSLVGSDQFSTSLDMLSDLGRGPWKLLENYMYVSDGSQLQVYKSQLPESFPFASLSEAKGVFIVLPNGKKNFTQVVIYFTAYAQLLDRVEITYNLAGEGNPSPSIVIMTPKFNHTVRSSSTPEEGWADTSYDIGSNRFSIVATVYKPTDYILIDKITAFYLHTTTSTNKPRTTTTPPVPKGSSGISHPSHFEMLLILCISSFLLQKVIAQ